MSFISFPPVLPVQPSSANSIPVDLERDIESVEEPASIEDPVINDENQDSDDILEPQQPTVRRNHLEIAALCTARVNTF